MATTIAKIIKSNVSAVQEHMRVLERAREIYLAGIKRLEAEYFERIKSANEILAAPPEAAPDDLPPSYQGPEQVQQPETSPAPEQATT
jgi:hypothetical protein